MDTPRSDMHIPQPNPSLTFRVACNRCVPRDGLCAPGVQIQFTQIDQTVLVLHRRHGTAFRAHKFFASNHSELK